jgi:hypothetical protein
MSSVTVPPPTTTSTIDDVLIDLTFVDPSGARRKVKGIVGKSNIDGTMQIELAHCAMEFSDLNNTPASLFLNGRENFSRGL